MAARSPARWIAIVIALLTLVALTLILKPRAPAPEDIPAQAPPRHGAALPSSEAKTSLLLFPISIKASALADLAEQLPEHLAIAHRRHRKKFRFGSISIDTDGDVWLSATRIEARDNRLIVSTDADAELHASLAGRRKTIRGRAAIDARIAVDVAADWTLKPAINLHYQWLDAPGTRVFGMDISLRREADRALQPQLAKLEQQWATSIQSKIDLRAQAQQLWTRLHQPIQIAKEPPVWLQVDPKALYWQPPRSAGDTLQLMLGVQARLKLVHGAIPPVLPEQALPQLDLKPPAESGLSLHLDMELDYPALTVALQQQLGSQSHRIEYPGGSAEVHFEEFQVYPSAPDLVVGARLRIEGIGTGSTRGWIYLRGQPRFDAEQQLLSVADLDFVSISDSPLLQTLSTLLRTRIREQLAAAARINLGERLSQLQDSVQLQLNQIFTQTISGKLNPQAAPEQIAEHIGLSARIDQLSLMDLVPGDHALIIRIALGGQLSMELR